jgi:hypothetical protein
VPLDHCWTAIRFTRTESLLDRAAVSEAILEEAGVRTTSVAKKKRPAVAAV